MAVRPRIRWWILMCSFLVFPTMVTADAVADEELRAENVTSERPTCSDHGTGECTMTKRRALEKACRSKARKLHKPERGCAGRGKTISWAGGSRRVGADLLARVPRSERWMSLDGDTSLDEAVTAAEHGRGATVYVRSFYGCGQGLSIFSWAFRECHEGQGYYNGEDVWPGRYGYHDCGLYQRENGYDVTVDNCYERKKRDGDYVYLQYWDHFDVSFVWHGNPATFNHDMHINLHKSGTLTYWQGDHKVDESQGEY